MMQFLSLFAGIGGFDLGLERAGHECIGQVELTSFCQRVLARHWPHVTRSADVRKWQSNGYESIDLLCGGFPCQDLSVAGKRAGLQGERSGLFWEIVRIAKEVKPIWGLFENVPGLLSSHNGRDMWTVLTGLRECWPVVGYRVLDSLYFGVAQRRRRVFFVCGPTERSVREILFESESCLGHTQTSKKTGEGVAATLRSRTQKPGVNMAGRGGEDDVNIILAFQPKASATQSMNVHPLAPSMGTTKEIGVIAATLKQRGRGATDEVMDNLQQTPQGVRRLTPIECSRLQGFPDDWLCLCGANENLDACVCPDSPRYRTLGNAVTVNVITWLGKRFACTERQQ